MKQESLICLEILAKNVITIITLLQVEGFKKNAGSLTKSFAVSLPFTNTGMLQRLKQTGGADLKGKHHDRHLKFL